MSADDEPEAEEVRQIILNATWKPCSHGGGWWVARDADGVERLMAPDAFAALPAVAAPGVRVKPLEWTARDDLKGLHEARGADGLYRNVWDQRNGTWVYEGDPTANPQQQARFSTLDAAKAAAQADYEARILAALDTPAPALMDELVEALRQSHEALLWCAREGRMASPLLHQYPAKWAAEAGVVLAKWDAK